MRALDGTKLVPQVATTFERFNGHFDALFTRLISELEPVHVMSDEAEVQPVEDAHALVFDGEIALDWCGNFGRELVFETPSGAIAHVYMPRFQTIVWVAADNIELARSERDALVAKIGPLEKTADDRLPVKFWSKQHQQVESITRELEVSGWKSVEANYAAGTREELQLLMGSREPDRSGLILWTGEPGSGKSRAVEALADSWREWCDTHFITDPEEFLWHGSWYMLHVAAKTRSMPRKAAREARNNSNFERWQLIVLEDSGELLTVDASRKTGQGMARLLNLTDGALGHGLQTIVLLTTNEPMSKIHPAVSRPGRCLQLHEFERLSVQEANAWLKSHGLNLSVSKPTTLAELYAMKTGDFISGNNDKAQIGFAA